MSDVAAVQNLVEKHRALKKEIAKIIVGQETVIDQILLSIYTGGHSLLIGVPGLAKTLMVNTIAQTLGLELINQISNHFGLFHTKRRSRLIHDQDLGIEIDGTADRHRLPLTT